MPFLIYTLENPGKETIREALREQHRAHLRSIGKKLLASGALLADDKQTVIGGISLIDTDNRSEAEAFAFNDPYAKADIHRQTDILLWRKRWWEGEFLSVDKPELNP